MKSIVPGAALAVMAIPQHLFPPLPLPPPLCCWQRLHINAAYPRTVRDKTKAGDSPGMSPPVQSLGLSTADVVQNQAHPCKGVPCKKWACAGLTPKQLGTPHLHPKRAGEPGMQDGVQAEASNPPPAPWGQLWWLLRGRLPWYRGSLCRRTPAYCTASIPI